MKFKNLFLIPALCFSSAYGYAQSWNIEIENEIENGNFTRATELIDKLPEQIKIENQYTVDSLNLIIERIKYDFSLMPYNGYEQIRKDLPGVTSQNISDWVNKRYIESMIIDGQEMWFRKAVKNLWLINPEMKQPSDPQDTANRLDYIAKAQSMKLDKNNCSNWHHATIKYVLDVDADAVEDGTELKAWLPIPLETARQKNFKLISSSSEPTYSKESPHNTVQLIQVAKKGEKTHFEIEFSYDVAAQSYSQEYLLKHSKPYKKQSQNYKKYTVSDGRHILVNDKMKQLAESIVKDEINPVKQASMIFNWIVSRYPWAGARDYGTIKNIPEYVLLNNHGDCGQVALLYISLTRSIGIPSRWESGWMLHPGELGWHDWAETYFEGIGWVPTDVSFGRNDNTTIRDYYKTGTDVYRFASNCDYGKPLSPRKKYLRSEPIDFQAGEVECAERNIEKTQFDSELIIKEFIPIKY